MKLERGPETAPVGEAGTTDATSAAAAAAQNIFTCCTGISSRWPGALS
jgi:hypothetical protein